MAKGFAVSSLGIESMVRIEARCALRCLLGAGPLNTRRTAQFLIAQPTIIAGPTTRTHLPRFKAFFCGSPLDERCAVFVLEIHTTRILDEDLEVRLRLTGGFNGLLGQVDRTIGIGIAT